MKRRVLLILVATLAFPSAAAAASERAVEWELVGAFPDATAERVRIRFGVDVCGGNQDVQRVDVARDAGVISISVFDEDPDGEGTEVCPKKARLVERTVDLGEALGDRSVVDGSAGVTVVPAATPEADWFFAARVRPRSRRLPFAYAIRCEGSRLSRIVVERRRRSIIITPMVRVPKPCVKTELSYPVTSVELQGRVGRRTIRDGAASPSSRVYRPRKRKP